MKVKHILLFIFVFFMCACQTLQNTTIDELTIKLNQSINKVNTYRTGYSYYLPSGLSVKEYSLYNEVIESENITFYLYVDLISYFNKINFDYQKNNSSYFSKALNADNKSGYLEINLKENNQYLIEIMFNYAKIEMMVEESDINNALNYAIAILRSVNYSDEIINNLLNEDILSYQEETYNIFNTTSGEKSNYLMAVEQDQYVEEQTIKDSDLINN